MSKQTPLSVDDISGAEVGASQQNGLPAGVDGADSPVQNQNDREADQENSSNDSDDSSCFSSSSDSSEGSQDGDDDGDTVEVIPAPAKKSKPNSRGSGAASSSAASAPAEQRGTVSVRKTAPAAAGSPDGGARRIAEEAPPERIAEEAPPESSKRKPSSVWDDFDVCAMDSDYAVCKHCKARIKRCGGTSSMTKHRNGVHSAMVVARNQPEPRQSTLDGSVTIGPRFLTDCVKWILLKYKPLDVTSDEAYKTMIRGVSNVKIPSRKNIDAELNRMDCFTTAVVPSPSTPDSEHTDGRTTENA